MKDLQNNLSPCIWMQAGIVKKKECKREYNCYECPFDKAMSKASKNNPKFRHWKEALLDLPAKNRPCIHTLKKKIKFKGCINEYKCHSCEFNQYFEDTFWVKTLISPVTMLKVWGISIPHGFYLHPSHIWVRLQGNREALIGLDDFVKKILGPLKELKVPLMGKKVKKDRSYLTIKKANHIIRIPLPISGIVIEVNPGIYENPSWYPSCAYEEWLLKIHSTNLIQEIKDLMIEEESKQFMEKEVNYLTHQIEETYGPLCMDGGELNDNIYEKMPLLPWERLFKHFFKG